MIPILDAWSDVARPVIGMLHAPPLPGSPRFHGDIDAVRQAVLRDAQALAAGGVHGLLLENFGDAPFCRGRAAAHVVSHMTALACHVRQCVDLPLGVNVLRNDGQSALAVAHAAGAQFIRVNVLCGARLTDQGIVEGIAHDLLRLRRNLNAEQVKILADVNVKHSAPLAARPLGDEVAELLERGGADAVIVTGRATGQAVDRHELASVKAAAGDAPVLLGSGVTVDNVAEYAGHADGFIVGTSFKGNGDADHPVDGDRVTALLRRLADAASGAGGASGAG